MPAAIPAIAVAATVASTAVSVYGSVQQGRAAERAAEFNAAMARQNAKTQAWNAEMKAMQDMAAAKSQSAWLEYQAKVSERNALALTQEMKNKRAETAENQRRARRAKARTLSSQRAKQAAAGLNIGTGTVVENLAETSKILELDIIEMGRQSEIGVQRLWSQSRGELANAARSRAEANMANFAFKNAQFNRANARYIVQHGNQRADMLLAQGRSARRAANIQALGSAVGGVASFGGQFNTFSDVGAF